MIIDLTSEVVGSARIVFEKEVLESFPASSDADHHTIRQQLHPETESFHHCSDWGGLPVRRW